MGSSKYILVAALFLGMVFSACKKEEPKDIVLDYRGFFVGSYKGIGTTTETQYIGNTTNTYVMVDSNQVYTFTKNGDYPSTEVRNQSGAIYFLVSDDNTHTRATNLNGDKITLGNNTIRIYSNRWTSSSTSYSYVFEGTRIQ